MNEPCRYYEFASHGDVQGEGMNSSITAREFAGLVVGLVPPGRVVVVVAGGLGLVLENMFGFLRNFVMKMYTRFRVKFLENCIFFLFLPI